MRILIYGAGAVGSVLGGLLARSGHQLTLLGRPDHVQTIRQRGLCITGIWGDHHVRVLQAVTEPIQLDGVLFDLVLLTVKAYDTRSAIEELRRLKPEPTTIVSVQNGYGNTQALEAAFGRGRVLGARIITGVEHNEPGVVTVTVSADDIRLGPPGGEQAFLPVCEELAQMFRQAGIPTTATDRYESYLWAKILYNCALNPLGALLRATYGELAHDPGTSKLIDQIIAESFSVACRSGVRLFWDTAEQYRRHFYEELIPPTAGHYPSMLRDLERRGRTEIDSLNGAVVQLARQVQIAVPLNEALTTMISLREQTKRRELTATIA